MLTDQIQEAWQALLSAIEALQQAYEIFKTTLATDETVNKAAFEVEDATAKALRKRQLALNVLEDILTMEDATAKSLKKRRWTD